MKNTGTIVVTVIVTAVVVVMVLALVGMNSNKGGSDGYVRRSSVPSNVSQETSNRPGSGSGKLDQMQDLPDAAFAPNAVDLKEYLRSPSTNKTLVQTNDAVACDEVVGQQPKWIRARESFMHICIMAKSADELRAYDRHSSSARVQMYAIMTGDQNVPNSRRAWVVQASEVDRSDLPATMTNMPFLDFAGYGDSQ